MAYSLKKNSIINIIKLPLRNVTDNNQIKTERQNKFMSCETKNKKRISPKLNTSYHELINQYSKSKDRYNSVYLKRKKGANTFLEKIYIKYQKVMEKYFKDSKNKKGLRLEGNKKYEKEPIEKFINEIDSYMEHIQNKLKENNLFYLYPNDDNKLSEKLRLTPIPHRNRILMNTNKEKEDFSNAERSAVLLRRVEYTHGLTTTEGKNEFRKYLKMEREKIFFILKEAILTIENWWIRKKGLKDKIKKNRRLFNSNNNNDLEDERLKIIKIFIKQMEIFYYMKKNKKEKKKLYIKFLSKLKKMKINDKENNKIYSPSVKDSNTNKNYLKNRSNENTNIINFIKDECYYYSTENKTLNNNEIKNQNKLKYKSPIHGNNTLNKKENILKNKYDIIIINDKDSDIDKDIERKGQKMSLINKTKNSIPHKKIKNYIIIPSNNKTSRNNNNNNILSPQLSLRDNKNLKGKDINEKYKFIIEKSKNVKNDNQIKKNKRFCHRNNERISYQFKDVNELINKGNCFSKDNIIQTEQNKKKKIGNMKKQFIKREKNKELFYNGKKKNNNESIEKTKLLYENNNNIKSPQSMRSVKIFNGDISQDSKERKFKQKLSMSNINNKKTNLEKKIKKSSSLLQISNTESNLCSLFLLKQNSFSKNYNKKEDSIRNKSFEQKKNINKEIEFQNNTINTLNNTEVQKIKDLIDEKSVSISIINNKLYDKENENQIKIKNIQNNNNLDVINNSTENNNIYNPTSDELIDKSKINSSISNNQIEININDFVQTSKTSISPKNNLVIYKSLNSTDKNIGTENYNNLRSSLDINKNNIIISFISGEKDNKSTDSNNLINNSKNCNNDLNNDENGLSYSNNDEKIKKNINENNDNKLKIEQEKNIDNIKNSDTINTINITNNNNKEKKDENNNEIKNKKTLNLKKFLKRNKKEKEKEIETENQININEDKNNNIITFNNLENSQENNLNIHSNNTDSFKSIGINTSQRIDSMNLDFEKKNNESEISDNYEIPINLIPKNPEFGNENELLNNIDDINNKKYSINEKMKDNKENSYKKLTYLLSNKKTNENNNFNIDIDDNDDDLNIHQILVYEEYSNRINKEKSNNINNNKKIITSGTNYFNFNNSFSNDNSNPFKNENHYSIKSFIKEENSTNLKTVKNNSFFLSNSNKRNNINLNDISDDCKLNNSRFADNKLVLENNSFLTINHKISNFQLTEEEKIEKMIFLILISFKQEFFGRLVLNYLNKNKINMQDEELIDLLKLGKSNTYQKILNNSLKLNLTNVDYRNKEISFKDWVKKFIKNKNDYKNEKELKEQYKIFLNIKKILHKKDESEIFDSDILKKIPKNGNKESNEIIESVFEERKSYFSKLKNSTKLKKKLNINNNSFDSKNHLKLSKNKLKENIKLPNRLKRDTSKDIMIPNGINISYNLIRRNKETPDFDILREINDEPEKF